MAKQPRTRHVSAAQARSYLSKAEEYLAAAENSDPSGHRGPRSVGMTSL
jgi:hypothetical protein